MKKTLLLSILTMLLFAGSYAQNALWKQTNTARLSQFAKTDRASIPSEFKVYTLDLPAMKAQLQLAPLRSETASSTVIIQFPNAEGTLENFRMYQSPVMEPELAAKYPEIQTYIGKGIENPATTIHLSTTIFGLHVMALTNNGTSYIDPYTKDTKNYMVYKRSHLVNTISRQCGVISELPEELMPRNAGEALVSDGIYRTYRLAMACTAQYAAFHIAAAGLSNFAPEATRKQAVLAAMVVTMARVNGLYERDMSLHMNLVANNDLVIFVNAGTQPFTGNSAAGTLINESQTVINQYIGVANYDIGHTVSTGGGGLAQLNSPCGGSKARGITGSGAPVGDPYDIDYVAHEMGHQFGANHTFNNSCGGNRNGGTAVEPGSGVTIMGYAGICAPDIQSNSDDHFHAISIAEMTAFVTNTGTCSTNIASGNTAPSVNAGADYTIPNGTAFILKGEATDANGDALTYCWEQTNNQISTQPPLPTATAGPNVTSDSPKASPNRYIPNFESVLAGNLSPSWEMIPTVARAMNFALTVRDNRAPNGGQTRRDDMVVNFAAVGPFAITSHNVTNQTILPGATQTVTWSVAGTTANGINTANVNILLSTDNGVTFNTVLAANTPNDGSETVVFPSMTAPYCRIMIEPVGNIYYAVSKSIALGYSIVVGCETFSNTTALIVPDGAGNGVPGPNAVNTINVPATGIISDVNVALNVAHTYPSDLQIIITHPDGTSVAVWNRSCGSSDNFNITLNDGSPAFTCVANMTGSFSPSSPLSAFNGKPSAGVWKLTANDNYAQDTGRVISWGLVICSETSTLGHEDLELTDFTVYPNPNNGSFNVKFNGNASNPVKVLVHDMRGRVIFEKDYANSATFNENITVNAQTGMYILTVSDGERKMTKKIAVN